MSGPLVSIVVPVYNVESYIEECLQSVCSQTYENLEIICVDDVGNDRSMDVVRSFAVKDCRIKIIEHDKNKGLAEARNTGLEHVSGDYVFFLDSDDWLSIEVTADGYEIGAPRLISMLEDHIQGFTGAGPLDNDPWSGTYMDGTVMYEPMSRGTGELQYPRQLSLQVFTKNIQVGTQSVSVAVTQEQVTDLQKQWGIDVVKMIENAAINELSMSINKHILSRLFALGWKNHVKLNEVEGVNLVIRRRNCAATGAFSGMAQTS